MNGVTETYGLKEWKMPKHDDVIEDSNPNRKPTGIKIGTHFSKPGVPVDDQFDWASYNAEIRNDEGKVIFQQEGIEAPQGWSQQAVNIVASKYFRGHPGTPEREDSINTMVGRVVGEIAKWGEKGGYFATQTDSNNFYMELAYILLDQRACFNSPVWFNVGLKSKPQCSACFILKIEDDMESILNWYREEGMIFKGGSGAGINLSPLRAQGEKCEDHGHASGPISFMRAADASAGVIKSGGKTRRAAKMVILNVDHPDIMKFINCKRLEERKARALEAAGYSGGMDGEATQSVFFQNANNSVRVPDIFMESVEHDTGWWTRYRTKAMLGRGGNGEAQHYAARDIFRQIAEAAWECGDPGMQFDTTINNWHTCPNSGRINASNPCGEYMHLDNSACNLASINLMKFVNEEREFDIAAFQHTVRIMITAMDILIDNASYPTPAIEKNAHNFRQLGLGFANLGAFLMYNGLPYDSAEGRARAGYITSLMAATAYEQSALLAAGMGPFAQFLRNKEPMLSVIAKHEQAHRDSIQHYMRAIWDTTTGVWESALRLGKLHGYRNSQTVVIAPTGTIAFMMDCDTTGIEPALALTMTKHLAGGGDMVIYNRTVRDTLVWLGSGIEPTELKQLPPEQRKIFQTAFGDDPLRPEAHVLMMAACQPFVSGAISKTVNLPADATVEDVERIYKMAWQTGLKAIAIYRDGSKTTQPLTVAKEPLRTVHHPTVGYTAVPDVEGPTAVASASTVAVPAPVRHKMPKTRQSVTHKFNIGGQEGYLMVGLYPDGSPGEIFLQGNKQGSTMSGLMDAFATAISFALQWGVPLNFLTSKFKGTRFEPSGFTHDPDIPQATSIVDYVAQFLDHNFHTNGHAEMNGNGNGNGHVKTEAERQTILASALLDWKRAIETQGFAVIEGQGSPREVVNAGVYEYAVSYASSTSGMLCRDCGEIMHQSGSCFTCMNCGFNSGCG